MSRQAFVRQFKEYSEKYAEKNFESCIEMITAFDLKANYLTYTEQVDFVLRSAYHALYSSKRSKTEQTVSIANGFTAVLSELVAISNYKKIMTMLFRFTNVKESERFLPIFTEVNPSKFDLQSWLRAIRTSLFQALNNAGIKDNSAQTKQKEIYVELTRVLLFFVNAETQRIVFTKSDWKLTESKHFLEDCIQFKLFKDGDKQYTECFQLLSRFFDCLNFDARKGDLAEHLRNFNKKFKEMSKSKKLRATLVQDNFITASKIMKICEQRFIKSINAKNYDDFVDLVGNLTNGANQSKTDKAFCQYCEHTGNHLSHDLSMLAIDIFTSLVNKKHESKTLEKVAALIRIDLEVITKLVCSKTPVVQQEAYKKFINLMKNCDKKESAELMIPILKTVLTRCHRIKLENMQFDEVVILNYLFTATSAVEDWEKMIEFGFLLLAFGMNGKSPNFEHQAWKIAKKQKDLDGHLAIKTPYDYFNQIKTESLYGLKLPQSFCLTKLTLEYLRIGMKYNVISTELSRKIVHQLLMSASKSDPSPLRFVLFIQSMNFDKITDERVEALINSLQLKGESDCSIGLQVAAMKYYKFNYESTELSENYKDMSIRAALTEEELALDTSVFKQITLDREKNQIKTLRCVKSKYIRFADFYLNKSDEERKAFEDEKELLLRDLKVVANQFVVRGYIDDGLDLFMVLHRLSSVINDEFGIIDSCSFFAEYCSEFKQKFPKENLSEIVKMCFNCVISKLKELKKLSARKQNQVCFCMLNLVLFYYEDDGDHKREIHTILMFIFKTVGGVGDQDMGKCMNAAVGFHVGSDDSSGPIVHSEAVRIKFYSTMFTIVTKFNAPSSFNPATFVYFVMEHVKKYINVYFDSSAAVPILLYNMVPQMIIWMHSIYESHVNHHALMLTLLKLSIRSGYALRTTSLMVTMVHRDLLIENIKHSNNLFIALENVMLSSVPGATQQKNAEKAFNIDENGALCEPIRKQGQVISPVKNYSSSPTTQTLLSLATKFLPNHSNTCKCGACSSPLNQLHMFCTAVVYARYVYINDNEFNPEIKKVVFNKLFKYWESNYKDKCKFPRCDMFYVISARMLLYYGHYTWKFEKDEWEKAKELVKRGLKGMEKVKFGACLIKEDLKYQIDEMEETIKKNDLTREQQLAGIWILNERKRFIAPALKNATAPVFGLLDMIKEPLAASGGFQIHGDDVTASTPKNRRPCFPSFRKEDDRTPSTRTKSQATESATKTAERPTRSKRYVNHLIPKVTYDFTESSPETQASPETPVQSSTKKPPNCEVQRKPRAAKNKAAREAVYESNETFQPKK